MKPWDRYFSYFRVVGIFVAVTLGASGNDRPLAQEAAAKEQLQQELQVMKSILSTTLSFVAQSEQAAGTALGTAQAGRVGVGRIDALYLKGQGAVFMIPIPNGAAIDPSHFAEVEQQAARLEGLNDPRSAEAELRLLRSLTRHGQFASDELRAMAESEAMVTIAGNGEAPEPLPSPRPSVRTAKKRSPAEIKQEIQKLKQELAAAKNTAAENRSRLVSTLIDVLARYGDSLSQLQSDEHVNLVVSGRSGFGGLGSAVLVLPDLEFGSTGFGSGGSPSNDAPDIILTAGVSDIRDFRAGRIDRATFKSRIEKY